MEEKLKFGIGFITGRTSICDIINSTYKFLLKQVEKEKKKVELEIFMLFDMNFQDATREQFYNLIPEVYKNIEVTYITPEDIEEEKKKLIGKKILKQEEADKFFGYGYARARNTLMYMAARNKVDYFLFWDDDEYPVACIQNNDKLEWKIQNNIAQHIKYMKEADITLGQRCGYTSPIPYIDLNKVEDESAVEAYINAVKNEFTTWEKVKEYWTTSKGVTYSDKKILKDEIVFEKGISEETDFVISGSPLCLNLQNIDKIPAFYNPEGARGEDVFFTLALKDARVLQIPVYHFHDSFLTYTNILNKEYPDHIEDVNPEDENIKKRFIKVSKGWMKYRPLYLYISDRKRYEKEIKLTKENLQKGVPIMNKIFGTTEFNELFDELEKYHNNVEKDYAEYLAVNKIWKKIKEGFSAKNELISVVVPVYNVEEYLEKCVNSIINQTYKNIEIILVDDGSKDNSGKMCDKLSQKDERIKVIHKKNGGLSDARNAGIKIANGDYIGFVDSDDYIEEDMFETLYKLIKENNSDISIVSFNEIYNGKLIGVKNSKKLEKFTKIEALKELLIDNKIQSYAWNKLFKRKLFTNIEFPTNKNFEDIATTLLLFEKANKVVLLEEPKYNYVRRDNSIVGVKNYKTYKDYLDVISEKYAYLDGKYEELDLWNAYNFVINMIWVYTIIVTFDLDDVYKEFEKHFGLFKELIQKYGNELIEKLDNYNKIVLYMLLLDRETSKPAVKALYKAFKEKRNDGTFELQI